MRFVLPALVLLIGWTVEEKPNFVVINIDDLGYADIGPFGSTLHRTPQLDRMAREGRKLTSFYAAPVCSPSRAALMTGCYPKRVLGIPHVLFPAGANGLAPAETTVAELLKERGYATAIVGKWHLGDQPEFLPTRQGFDEFFGLPYSNDMGPAADGVKSDFGKPLPEDKGKGQPPLPLLRNETVLQRVRPEDQVRLVELYTAEAERFIRARKDGPFFLYLAHSSVHFPIYPGKDFRGKSKNGLYGDWVEETDASVGRVLDLVRELGLEKKTLVLFTSDNGGTPRAVNRPLRGNKGSTLEGGMRVPTIAWWPGRVPAGTETDAVAGMIDVLPTLAKLSGAALPAGRVLDGRDLWPVLTGDARGHDAFYYYKGLKLEAVRGGAWKLHLAKGELYDLSGDPGESKNLAAEKPDEVRRLQALADRMKDDLGQVADPRPLIAHDGSVREGFGSGPK
jgi:arylsulfatase A